MFSPVEFERGAEITPLSSMTRPPMRNRSGVPNFRYGRMSAGPISPRRRRAPRCTLSQTLSIRRATPRAVPCRMRYISSPRRASRALPPVSPDHQLQSGPDGIDGGDLDVDKVERERRFPHAVLSDVGRHLRRFLGPRHPERAVGLERRLKRAEPL